MDRRTDIIVAAAFALFGLIVIISATEIRQGMMRDPVGPRLAFYVCGGMMLIGGLWVVAGHLMRWSRDGGNLVEGEGVADEDDYPSAPWRAVAFIALAALYAVALEPAGYLLATPAFLVGLLFLFGKRGAVPLIVIPIAFTILAYLIFAEALGVRLPVGPFTGLFRDLGWITL